MTSPHSPDRAGHTVMDMQLAAYLGTVLGKASSRLDRLQDGVDRLHDIVAGMGARVTAIEQRPQQ